MLTKRPLISIHSSDTFGEHEPRRQAKRLCGADLTVLTAAGAPAGRTSGEQVTPSTRTASAPQEAEVELMQKGHLTGPKGRTWLTKGGPRCARSLGRTSESAAACASSALSVSGTAATTPDRQPDRQPDSRGAGPDTWRPGGGAALSWQDGSAPATAPHCLSGSDAAFRPRR